jgi:ribosomal protein L2
MRPLYKEELDEWCRLWKNKSKEIVRPEKKRQKSLMKHVDICSNAQLKKYDISTVVYDEQLNSNLWKLYEIAMENR